jgi:hypothetical protein
MSFWPWIGYLSIEPLYPIFWKTVSLQAPSGREVIFVGSALKYSITLLYQLFPNRWVRKFGIIFATMDNGEALFL